MTMKIKSTLKYLYLILFFISDNLIAQFEIPVVAQIARRTDGTSPRVSTAHK